MDQDTRIFLEAINRNLESRIESLEKMVRAMHTPASCDLSERVRAIEIESAHGKGMMVVIGGIAGIIASAVIAFFSRMK